MVELNTPVAVGIVAAIVAAGTAGLYGMDVMANETIFRMVLPSMVAFAAVVFLIGVAHGQYRAST